MKCIKIELHPQSQAGECIEGTYKATTFLPYPLQHHTTHNICGLELNNNCLVQIMCNKHKLAMSFFVFYAALPCKD